jgi:hypothetical protein
MLPNEFLSWQTTYGYFRKFRLDGTWEKIHNALRESVRQAAGRERTPSAAIIDSQSVKTTEKGGFVGMMPGKKSLAANATLSLIPWGLLSWSLFMPRIFRIATAQNWSWKSSKANLTDYY